VNTGPGERRVRRLYSRSRANPCDTAIVPARLNRESPGFKRLVEAARSGEFKSAHLIARERLLFGDIWLEAGESFHCANRLAAWLIDEGSAERIADPS
jgi:hypothetical protein